MPDPKKPSDGDSESGEDDHGGALAKTLQQIEDDLPSEEAPAAGDDEGTLEI